MTVQLDEKRPASFEAGKKIGDFPEDSLDNQAGWRIAREALVREVVRYGGQGAMVAALIAVIGYAGYWSLGEMKSLPSFVEKVSKPFMPPPVVPGSVHEGVGKISEEKTPPHPPVKKHHYRPRNIHTAAKVQHRQYAASADDPTGGHIIYSDGMITQYSWNK